MNEGTVIPIIAAAAAVVSALVAVLLLMIQLRSQNSKIQRQNEEQLKKQRQFEQDWNGEPARPGVPERPGMLERVRRIEQELKPNGGGSIRDAMTRLEREQVFQRGELTKITDELKRQNGQGPTP